jgi:hypothetical protein
MLGLCLLYVGAVLVLNGLWLLGQIGDREIWIINVFAGTITMLAAMHLAFSPAANASSIKDAALTLLFSCTYFWVAIDRCIGVDGRGLGWFSLFVAVTAVPVAIDSLLHATTPWGIWLALCWFGWAFLWLLFFALLALKLPITRFTGVVSLITGILTGWLPGYLLLFSAIR